MKNDEILSYNNKVRRICIYSYMLITCLYTVANYVYSLLLLLLLLLLLYYYYYYYIITINVPKTYVQKAKLRCQPLVVKGHRAAPGHI